MAAEMANHTESDSRMSSIIGMALFTPHVPDLQSLKRTLLTGKTRTDQVQPVEGLYPKAFQIAGQGEEIMDNGHENIQLLIPLVIHRALEDTCTKKLSFGYARLGVVVHSAPFFQKYQISVDSKLAGQVDQRLAEFGFAPPVTMVGIPVGQPFNQAVDKAHTLLQAGSCEYVAVCGIFAYSRPGSPLANESSVPNEHETQLGAAWGGACLLLSNHGKTRQAYAELIFERVDINQEMTSSQTFSSVGIGQYAVKNSQYQTTETEIESNPVTKNVLDVPASLGEKKIEWSTVNSAEQNLPNFLQTPIIRLMRSALSLNSRTHFSDFDEIRSGDGDLAGSMPARIRPWFLPPYQEKRESEILINKTDSQTEMVWLQKDAGEEDHPDWPFSNLGLYLLPLDLNEGEHFNSVISDLENEITTCRDLNAFARASISRFSQNRAGSHTLVLLGRNKQDFVSELERARTGVEKANREGANWQTPAGSFFTPEPLGGRGKIAFVYPGAFGTYVGMGREIFYLFPWLHKAMEALTDDPGRTINEAVIYPPDASSGKLNQQQDELDRSPTRMISSGTCFSYLFTSILRDIFKVQPQAAFGYSLGEISMMFSMGIWSQADAMRTSLEVSPVFQERVSGPQNAIREFWSLPAAKGQQESQPLWSNLVLLAPVEKVKDAVENEDRVYITHVNAPRQVVIGGEPGACQRVVSNLKCMHLETPYRHAIHCPPVISEFNHFLRLNDWPIEQRPDIPVYSAAHYAALEYDPKRVAEGFARMLTQPIDFPRLVELAYQDGARIFIELGAGSNCSKWVESTLKGSPHASFSINANQVSDYVSILALLARLISHQVPLELDALVR